MSDCLALCSRIPGNELVAAECSNLTGGIPESTGVALCNSIERIPHAAFVQAGLRLIAQAETLSALVQAIAARSFPAEDFRIECLRLSKRNPVRWKEAVVAIADAVKAFPNLDFPRHRFMLVITESLLWFGEILAETSYSYQRHDRKPYRTSSSLPAQLARALVNLVVPSARSILDPCCGTGSILLEAGLLGVAASGVDKNPRMVHIARKNLAHFGYPAEVRLADARRLTQVADAVVTDLPYGKFSPLKPREIQAILSQCARLAPLGVFVAGEDISTWLDKAGYQDIEVFPVRKREDFSRFVHRARSETFTGSLS